MLLSSALLSEPISFDLESVYETCSFIVFRVV